MKRVWPLLATGVVSAAACWLLVSPISREDSHFWRMVVAGLALLFVGIRVVVRNMPGAITALRCAMLGTVVAGWFNYYQFDREVFAGINDYTDITYYDLNSKYLDELGYYGFYAAMLLADQETNNRHTSAIRQYRDLRVDEIRPVSAALEHGRELKSTRFTPERWEQFCADNDWFLSHLTTETMRENFYVDHGYNPPPTWTIVGGALAESTPLSQLKAIASVDIVLVGLMFAAVAHSLGFEAMLWGMLFFVCTFSGRWPILGQALLRFDWVAALVGSFCFHRKGRWGTAGGLLAYAALNRIFPAIFFFPWLVSAIRDTVAEGRIPARHLRFTAGAALISTLLIGGALARYGPEVFRESAGNLTMHNESFSSQRVGLGAVLVWRGETTRAQINANGGMAAKETRVRALQPALKGAGLVSLGLIAAFVWRSKRPAWALSGLAVLPFFCMTNAQVNYYDLRLLLIVWHATALAGWLGGARAGPGAPAMPAPGLLDRWPHAVGLTWLYGVEVIAQAAQVADLQRHAVNSLASWALLGYLIAMIVWMIAGMRTRAVHDEAAALPELQSSPS